MPFDLLLAGALMLSVLIFALAGGADFGGGVWTVFARGERSQEQRKLIEQAIGPIWEANELWIIVSTVILWSAFTPAFSAFGTALFIPFVLAIAGILLRGGFFAFQIEAEEAPRAYKMFGEVFGSMSIITPFFLGLAAGAIASGRLRLNENELPVDGYFQPWLGPFPLIVGGLAVVTCAYLAAIYLTNDAAGGSPELQEDFRLRGIIAGILLGVLGLIAIPVTRADAPHMWEGLVPGGPASILMTVAALSLAASLVLLFVRRYWFARAAAIMQVTLTFAAWGVAQYPYLLVPDITIQDAASPRSVLVVMSVLVFVYIIVLGPSLYLLFRLFKSNPATAGKEEES